MRTEFEVRPAEEFMMKFFTPEHLKNACILKAEESSVELWIMLREDSCIFARMKHYFVTQLSYFSVQDDEEFESYNALITKLKNGELDKSLAEEVEDAINGFNESTAKEFLS